MTTILQQFIGTWRLLECSQTNPDGSVLYMWGKDAIGYIIYTAEGVMSVQIMRGTRASFHSDNLLDATSEECASLPQNYNAYFGTFDVDENQQTVTHHVQGHLVPNLIGQDNVRRYHFEKNRLLLTVLSGVKRDLLWEKI